MHTHAQQSQQVTQDQLESMASSLLLNSWTPPVSFSSSSSSLCMASRVITDLLRTSLNLMQTYKYANVAEEISKKVKIIADVLFDQSGSAFQLVHGWQRQSVSIFTCYTGVNCVFVVMWEGQVHVRPSSSQSKHTRALKWHIQISTKWLFKENELIREKIKIEGKNKLK